MYDIKLIKHNGKAKHYECEDYTHRTVTPQSVAGSTQVEILDPDDSSENPRTIMVPLDHVGVHFEMGKPAAKTIHIPSDGKAIYVQNSTGKTVNSFHWPLRPKPHP